MTGALRLEILSSLASVRDDVERHVAGLDRYRALKAIEKTLVEFPGLEDLTSALSDLRDSMQRQLGETREVRALQTIEKIMPDLSEVLAFLSERSEKIADAIPVSGSDIDQGSDAPRQEAEGINRPSAKEEADAAVLEVQIVERPVTWPAAPGWHDDPQQPSTADVRFQEKSDLDEEVTPANDTGIPRDDESPPKATVSYGIAQFLNADELIERPLSAERRHDDDAASQFVAPPTQEGRAA